ncbi:uncharacterized protein LOC114362092 [Ostrinia furnacalis]|uniref:uncharacterized protein LOC114362092 n=1 Tax=Ostrinia furnacalis TaxID=93504 RepID=UPI00103ADFFC|nr:uncharacterized protein LOC114362092 [Ostrinia furnacalis]
MNMDGPNIEHSDSDSGESWSIIENIPSYGDEVPEFPENIATNDRERADTNVEKDEDTDGISIISDSDPEPSTPFETNYKNNSDDDSSRLIPQYVTISPPDPSTNKLHESLENENDFLGDSLKHKTYVHRRNKRLSSVLNIIVLGSVITAAGVAIGHMWGAKNDCSMNTTPSVNKILSSLYKLQEENTYLRSKLKELTMMHNLELRKSGTENMHKPQNKCKKVFEDSLNNISDKPTKCVDSGDIPRILDPQAEQGHAKDFVRDINKLKHVYKQNKSWLDDEINKRIKDQQKRMKKSIKLYKKLQTAEDSEVKQIKDENFNNVLEPIIESTTETFINNADEPVKLNNIEDKGSGERIRISYADSLKSNQKLKGDTKQYNDFVMDSNINKDTMKKKPHKKDLDTLSGQSLSEPEFKKDDRYTGNKQKQDRKKHDRQKLHKKQKRKNKYEQWEMKGGYLKDYDDFSISSSQENEYVLKNPDKNFLAKDFERENYINQFIEDTKVKSDETHNKIKNEKHVKGKEKDVAWYEKRALLRNEARKKKLELELFGETSPNNASWYFRRGMRREQCRAKRDNSTYRKFAKHTMNYKIKH